MRAALHAIRPDEAPLPPALAATVAKGWIEHGSGAYLLRNLADHATTRTSDLHTYEAETNSQDIPRGDDLAELLGVSLAYARACLRQAQRPVTALFSISEPHDDVIPVTTNVTFWTAERTEPGFEHDIRPLMLLSNAKTDFLYSSTDEQEKVMADTVQALTDQGLPWDESVRKVNEFWGLPSRRWALLYGDWIGQRPGEHWARLITTA
ncbi:hypothetical protein [Lentzea flava]|nr:hypothetical protein [Lentzea flava]